MAFPNPFPRREKIIGHQVMTTLSNAPRLQRPVLKYRVKAGAAVVEESAGHRVWLVGRGPEWAILRRAHCEHYFAVAPRNRTRCCGAARFRSGGAKILVCSEQGRSEL